MIMLIIVIMVVIMVVIMMLMMMMKIIIYRIAHVPECCPVVTKKNKSVPRKEKKKFLILFSLLSCFPSTMCSMMSFKVDNSFTAEERKKRLKGKET